MIDREALQRLALDKHRELAGKIDIQSKVPLANLEDLSIYYTPGVAAVSSYVAEHPEEAAAFTIKHNTIAIVSDGSAVLGLGDIGPLGALPVMEGKAQLFKVFGGVDAYPIVLDVHTPQEIINAVVAIAPTFGGINLEDIAAPKCFEIEETLKTQLTIPVFHDDQHGTAIVVLAGLLNACRVTGRNLTESRIVLVGSGAAGTAVTKLLLLHGVTDIVLVDSKGILSAGRSGLDFHKQALVSITNPRKIEGTLDEALTEADILVGVSTGGIVKAHHIERMAQNPIVFAMANPTPEIWPDEAHAAGARVVATGRSDFPNQINNVLAFPGVFRGALDRRVRAITDEMKIQAAGALAALISHPTFELIIPSVFDKSVVSAIAESIR